MNKIFSIGMLAIFATTLFTSCSKYEEGPLISFRSKKARISNTWQIEQALDDGEDVTDQYDQYELEMLDDGDASLAALYTLGDLTFEYETDGTWSFEDSKEQLQLDFEDDDADRLYDILRLKEKELWLKEAGGNIELHLKPL
ncbi:hypothetical protein [Halocola ammonii]